jgi:hypothetical protein
VAVAVAAAAAVAAGVVVGRRIRGRTGLCEQARRSPLPAMWNGFHPSFWPTVPRTVEDQPLSAKERKHAAGVGAGLVGAVVGILT